jgi:ring-1,2-phenylacetyl-CoA epoxidase subunit PaaC
MTGKELKRPTLEYAIRLGDDALILGHRTSEWCSNGPFLEEDIALTNVALDYIGRARMYYGYAAELAGDKTEDDFVYLRDAREFRNLLIYELPRGDFAHTMARQLVIDVFNAAFLEELTGSKDETLAAIAAKTVKETRYHLRRSTDWLMRLGDGTEESRRRMQAGLDDVWGYSHELFDMDELEQQLADAGVAVDRSGLRAGWEARMSTLLAQATLTVPQGDWAVRGGRTGYHTEHLGHLLSELQFVQRAYPGLQW